MVVAGHEHGGHPLTAVTPEPTEASQFATPPATFHDAWEAYVDTQSRLKDTARKSSVRASLVRRLDAEADGGGNAQPGRFFYLDADVAPVLRAALRSLLARAKAQRHVRHLALAQRLRQRDDRRARACLLSWRRRAVTEMRALQRYSYRNHLAPALTAFLVWSVRVQATDYLRSREIDTKRGKYLVARVARLGVYSRLRRRAFAGWRSAHQSRAAARAVEQRKREDDLRREAAATAAELARVQNQLKASAAALDAANERADEARARREADLDALRSRSREEVARLEAELAQARDAAHGEAARLEAEAAEARAEASSRHEENIRLEARLARSERNAASASEDANRMALVARQEMKGEVVDLQETIAAMQHRLDDAEERAAHAADLQAQLDAYNAARLRSEALADHLSVELERKVAEAALLGADVRTMRGEHARAVGASAGMQREASEAFRDAEAVRDRCSALEADNHRLAGELDEARDALRAKERRVGELEVHLVEARRDLSEARNGEERASTASKNAEQLLRRSRHAEEERARAELDRDRLSDEAGREARTLKTRIAVQDKKVSELTERLAAAQAEARRHADSRTQAEAAAKAAEAALEAARDQSEKEIEDVRRECNAQLDELANVAGEARSEARVLSERLTTERLRPDALAAELSAAETENEMRSKEAAGLRATVDALNEELAVARMHIATLEAGERAASRSHAVSLGGALGTPVSQPSPGAAQSLTPEKMATTTLQRELARARGKLNSFEARETAIQAREAELLELASKAKIESAKAEKANRDARDSEAALEAMRRRVADLESREGADEEEKVSGLRAAHDMVQSRLQEVERELALSREQVILLTDEAARLAAEEGNKQEAEALRESVEGLRASVSQKDARIAELGREIARSKDQVALLEEELDRTGDGGAARIAELEEELRRASSGSGDEEASALRARVAELERADDNHAAEVDGLQAAIEGLRASVSQKDARIAELGREIARSKDQVALLEEELDRTGDGGAARIAELEEELRRASSGSGDEEASALRARVAELERADDDHAAEVDGLQAAIEGLRASVSQKDARIAELGREIARSKDQVALLEEELDRTASAAMEMQEELATAEEKLNAKEQDFKLLVQAAREEVQAVSASSADFDFFQSRPSGGGGGGAAVPTPPRFAASSSSSAGEVRRERRGSEASSSAGEVRRERRGSDASSTRRTLAPHPPRRGSTDRWR